MVHVIKRVSAAEGDVQRDVLASVYEDVAIVDARVTELHQQLSELRLSIERKLQLLAELKDTAAQDLARQHRQQLEGGERGIPADEFVQSIRRRLENS